MGDDKYPIESKVHPGLVIDRRGVARLPSAKKKKADDAAPETAAAEQPTKKAAPAPLETATTADATDTTPT